MTSEPGANASDEQNKSAASDGLASANADNSEAPVRKLAKTMLENELPQLPEVPQPLSTGTQSSESSADASPVKRVAKTQLELDRSSIEQAAVASASDTQNTIEKEGPSELPESQAPRKVPKTQLEISRPSLNKTKLEIERPDLSGITSDTTMDAPTSEPPTSELPTSEPPISEPPISEPLVSEPLVSESPRANVAKTMMEISLPAQSETAKQVTKVSKTMLDVRSLDAIGMAKALNTPPKPVVPVKVRKTLTQDNLLPDIDQINEALTLPASDYSATQPASARPAIPGDQQELPRTKARNTERFVAKTMLDHSVLSEQLVKSHEKEKMKAAYIAQEKANEPARDFHEVDSKKLAAPCAWTWNSTGSNKSRVQSCDKCQTQVYDFAGMEMPEAEALIFKQESKKKFTLYKRPDGKFMTSDCPVQAARKRNLVLLCVAGAIVMICAVAFFLLMPPPARPPVQADKSPSGSSRSGNPQGGSQPGTNNSVGDGSGSSSTIRPGADGKMHFEAGEQAPAPAAQTTNSSPSSFFVTVSGQQSANTNSNSGTSTTTTTSANPTATTTSTGQTDSQYWDSK